MYRIDLHTHSIISHDGGITDAQYRKIFADDKNFVAITDHNEVSFAKKLRDELGDQVIVGEEIMTKDGEIIGLFLQEKIQPDLSAQETIEQIKNQDGLVYIPHPFEKTRKGLSLEILQTIILSVDIIEVFNARTLEPWLSEKANEFAQVYNKSGMASSDAHGIRGLGSAYGEVSEKPTRNNLVAVLAGANLQKTKASFWSFLYPVRNKLKKKFHL